MKAINSSKSIVVSSDLKEASGFFPRLMGLIGKASLGEGEGLWMARCRAIHTIGMKFPIDVVFLDRDLMVKKVVKRMRPFCPISFCLSAKGVLELPAGTIENSKIQVGDRMEIVHTLE